MTDLTPFERRLSAALEAHVGPRRSVDGYAVTHEAVAGTHLRRRSLIDVARNAADRAPWRLIGAIALTGSVLAGAGIIALRQPPSAARAVVAYESGGDILVGVPSTGQTKAIVSGPAVDSSPIFSPDGSLIAFVRGNRWTADASILVVRRDGTDAKTVVPQGFSGRGIGFAWTPDGRSLVVNYDNTFGTPHYDGRLARFDATGAGQPQILTPPMALMPGTGYFGAWWVEVAGMFKPPHADQILSWQAEPAGAPLLPMHNPVLYLWDAQLRTHSELRPVGLGIAEPYAMYKPAWSPDAAMITFSLATGEGRDQTGAGAYIMNAAGTDARRLPADRQILWSPDSSRIAYQRCSVDPTKPGAVLGVLNVQSGHESDLAPTAVETKTEGVVTSPNGVPGSYCGGLDSPDGRSWDYEGWSWTPDGQSIVWLEKPGERPKVIDVELGTVAELPWEMDSPPSWRALP